ncbi:hypothetical protein [Roseibium sp.]|uniref:hypothetical protein n=1 Tax=Roseibium sp. TaxID=1936156 RepID=UPI003A97C855
MAEREVNKEKLERWLKTQPLNVSRSIAARAALRAFPSLSDVLVRERTERTSREILSLFRAVALTLAQSWVTSDGDKLSTVAVSALTAAKAASSGKRTRAETGAAYAVAHATRTLTASAVPTAAIDASTAATYASGAAEMAKAIRKDQEFIVAGGKALDLANQPLWHDEALPRQISDAWLHMKDELIALKQGWDVWTDWYEDRLLGEHCIQVLETARLTFPQDLWEQGPKAVNAAIRKLIEEHERLAGGEAKSEAPHGDPPEPRDEPGQRADVVDGELVLRQVRAPEEEVLDPLQLSLHELVQRRAADLSGALQTKKNQYPEVFKAAQSYLNAVDRPLADVDIVRAWSEGSALAELSEAYATQKTDRTVSEPLEPGVKGAISALVNDHSGFILGFSLGRLLTERADRMRQEGGLTDARMDQVLTLLSSFGSLRQNITAETREFIEFTEDTIILVGWETGRSAYRGYALIKTLLIGAGRFLKAVAIKISNEAANAPVGFLGGLLGIGVAAYAGAKNLQGLPVDPADLEAARQFAMFFRDNAHTVMHFASSSKELRIWLRHILEMLEVDGSK